MKKLIEAKDAPTTIKAGYKHFRIRIFGDVGGLSPRNMGAVTHSNRVISLDGSQCVGEGAEVLLHEICHLAWDLGGLDNVIGHDAEEKIVNIMSTHLATMMHDNPEVFRWIVKNVA